jgi:hypothetical protein
MSVFNRDAAVPYAPLFPPVPFTCSKLVLFVDWPDGPALPGATFCPLCREYLGGTCAPAGWPRCKSSGELRQERQYRD